MVFSGAMLAVAFEHKSPRVRREKVRRFVLKSYSQPHPETLPPLFSDHEDQANTYVQSEDPPRVHHEDARRRRVLAVDKHSQPRLQTTLTPCSCSPDKKGFQIYVRVTERTSVHLEGMC